MASRVSPASQKRNTRAATCSAHHQVEQCVECQSGHHGGGHVGAGEGVAASPRRGFATRASQHPPTAPQPRPTPAKQCPSRRVSGRPTDPTTANLRRTHQRVPPSSMNDSDNGQPQRLRQLRRARYPTYATTSTSTTFAQHPNAFSGTHSFRICHSALPSFERPQQIAEALGLHAPRRAAVIGRFDGDPEISHR